MKKLYFSLAAATALLPGVCAGTDLPLQVSGMPVDFSGHSLYESLTAPGMKNEGRIPAAEKKADYVPTIIYEPSGTAVREALARDGGGYYVVDEQAYRGEMFGISQAMAYDGDEVYFYKPVLQFNGVSWIKGIKRDDRLSFTLPQCVYEQSGASGTEYYYVTVMKFDPVTQWYKPYPDAEMPQFDLMLENGEYTFDCLGETSVTNQLTGLVTNFPNRIVGLVDATGEWMGYGDYMIRLYPHTDTLVEAPQGLETKEYTMVADGSGHYVNIGYEGNDIYIQGISTYNPESWVKGTVKDGKASLPSLQYLGVSSFANYHTYLFGLKVHTSVGADGKTVNTYENLDEVILTIDSENNKITAETDICVCGGKPGKAYLEFYPAATFTLHEGTGSLKPVAPIIEQWVNMIGDDANFGQIRFKTPTVSVENDILEQSRVSWRLLIDGEPFELDAVDYSHLDKNIEWIPFFYNDAWDIMWAGGIRWHLYFYIEVPESIGIQSRYMDEYGEEYLSEPTIVDRKTADNDPENPNNKPNAVDTIAAEDIKAVKYYDMMGRSINNPQKGIYVKVTEMRDGTVSASKHLVN